MTPHRIRLRRPWQPVPAATGIRWRRAFHRPTGLGPHDRVRIVVGPCPTEGAVSINGHQIGRLARGRSAARFDATERLELHNEMEIELAGSAVASGDQPPIDVFLEIESRG